MLASFPGDPKTAPPSYRYFIDIVERLKNVQPEDLTDNAVLIGNDEQLAGTLSRVQDAGFDEVILYFNVGLKEHSQVKEEMARFSSEVSPQFSAEVSPSSVEVAS